MSSNSHAEAHHVTPLWIYLGVWISLMVLTAITVWIAQFDFGAYNAVVAMAVATIKASLVAAFFMHLYWDEKMNTIAFLSSFFFVGLFFTFTFADGMTRGQVDPVEKNFIESPNKEFLPPLAAPKTAGSQGKKPEHHEAAPAGH
ncbi:MAG: cytochrome C oxidase subunit IV family protein [Myxococcota bacterium]